MKAASPQPRSPSEAFVLLPVRVRARPRAARAASFPPVAQTSAHTSAAASQLPRRVFPLREAVNERGNLALFRPASKRSQDSDFREARAVDCDKSSSRNLYATLHNFFLSQPSPAR